MTGHLLGFRGLAVFDLSVAFLDEQRRHIGDLVREVHDSRCALALSQGPFGIRSARAAAG